MDTNIFKKAYKVLSGYMNDEVSLGDLVMTMSKAIHVGQELVDKYIENQPTNTSASFTIPSTDEHAMLFKDDELPTIGDLKFQNIYKNDDIKSSVSYTTAPWKDSQKEYIIHVTNNVE